MVNTKYISVFCSSPSHVLGEHQFWVGLRGLHHHLRDGAPKGEVGHRGGVWRGDKRVLEALFEPLILGWQYPENLSTERSNSNQKAESHFCEAGSKGTE